MKKRLFNLLPTILFAVLMAAELTGAEVSGKSGIEAKVALESSLEGRLKRVLTEIAGTEDIIVIVNAELAKEQTKAETKKKDDDFILPGVPIREAISEKSVQSAVMSALGEDTRTLIRRLKATVIVNKNIASDTEKIVREVAAGLLGIDESRGDSLIIQKMAFRKQTFTFASLFYPPNIFWLIAVTAFAASAAAITAFLMGAGRDFTKNLVGAVEMHSTAIRETGAASKESSEDSSSSSATETLRSADVPAASSAASAGPADGRPFGFINAQNAAALNFILKTEPPAVAAAVIGYLEPSVAAGALESLPAASRAQVAQFLSDTRQLAPDETERLQSELKKKISYIVGGEAQVAAIIENTDEAVRDEIISRLASASPEKAEHIRKAVVTAQMLERADSSVVGLVVKHLGVSSFAQIVRSFPDDAREKMLAAMPSGAASRIRQEMELAKAYPPARLAVEKKRLVGLLKRMRAAGLIEI